MSFPTFKDLDKPVADLFSDDFDTKNVLKVKSVGPFGTTLTTNIEHVEKDGKCALKPKVSVKWPHPSGFTVEKFEVSNDCKLTVETSLSNAVPGLKVEFKGNDSDKADLNVKYSHQAATVTGDFDVNNLSNVEVGLVAGQGQFTGGFAAKLGNKDGSVTVNAGLTHNLPKVCFTSVRACNNFSAFSLLTSYKGVDKFEFAVGANHDAKKTAGKALVTYKHDCCNFVKAKVNSDAVVNVSYKRNFEKNFSAIAAVEVPTNNPKGYKWGLNLTLG